MELTDIVVEKMEDKEAWYGQAAEYWRNVEPSVDGMLGGFEKISDVDCKGSLKFLKNLKQENILTAPCHKALDCGAGIGRVSKHFLLKVFDNVDIVEQCEEFTKQVHNYMDDQNLSNRIENIYTIGLQQFEPKLNHYDLIWIQWVIGHLTDDDFVSLLKRCKEGLTPGGCIGIKDNVTSGESVYDGDDSSVTRTFSELRNIFDAAGLTIRTWEAQKGFPSCLFNVNMYALS